MLLEEPRAHLGKSEIGSGNLFIMLHPKNITLSIQHMKHSFP